ncbi:peptidase M38 [Phormidium willei BDU 130791]|nr:peptidase M38 [Phormidium willei BDU 130791]
MSLLLIENALLFDGHGPDLQDGASVLVEDGAIKEVAAGPLATGGAEVQRIDAAGRVLMPGLIDAHFHAVAADPNIARLETMSAYHIAQYARRFLEAALLRGFTSVRDAGGADFGLALAVESGLIKGPRLYYAGRALTQTGGHADFRERAAGHPAFCLCGQHSNVMGVIADGVAEVRRAAREELRKGASQIKIMASGGVASPADPIWNLQYSEEEIAAAVWEARSWKTYVMAHAYTPEAIGRCVELGVKSIEHGNLIDAETAALCAARGAWVVPTLVTYDALAEEGAALGLPPVSVGKVAEVRSAGLRALEILKTAGVKMGFGTDLLGEMHHHQSREFSIRAEVLSPLELLRQATSGNAELMGRGGKLGCVAAGAHADLLLVDGNPLETLGLLEGQGARIPLIVKAGEIVKNAL